MSRSPRLDTDNTGLFELSGISRGAALIVAMTGSAFAVGGADAHDAVSGWAYPNSCCSGYDCREVKETAISERPEGYVIQGTGEVLGYRDTRLKDSPDGEFHWCSVAGKNDSRTICLFVPPRSY